MFGKDIIHWALQDHTDERQVREVHLLKDGSMLVGPWLAYHAWQKGQHRMKPGPYPAKLALPYEVLRNEARKLQFKQVALV